MLDALSNGPDDLVLLCSALAFVLAGGLVPLGGRRVQMAFAYLVLERDRYVCRQELIAAVWPDEPPQDPAAALRTVLSRLRSSLGSGVVEGRERIRLVLPRGTVVDLEDAQACLQEAESALRAEDWPRAADLARRATRVLQRGFLEGLDAPWVEERRREVQEQSLRALEVVAAAGIHMSGNELIDAERAARTLIERSPLREAGHRLLIEALAARGEIAEALQAYDRARRLLHSELGIPPGRELVRLHGELIRAADAGLAQAGDGGVPQERLAAALAVFDGDAEALRAAVTAYLTRPAGP